LAIYLYSETGAISLHFGVLYSNLAQQQDKMTIPACFSCGVNIGVCPTKSAELKAGGRKIPEEMFG
jgi:heterodisulfide reductase subunit C